MEALETKGNIPFPPYEFVRGFDHIAAFQVGSNAVDVIYVRIAYGDDEVPAIYLSYYSTAALEMIDEVLTKLPADYNPREYKTERLCNWNPSRATQDTIAQTAT